MSEIKHFDDLAFTVVATPHSHRVEYVIYDCVGYTEDGKPLWSHKKPECCSDLVDCVSDAAIYLHGSVKWDGCSNWHFDEQDRVMLHGCSREHLLRLGEVMARCWDWTAVLCPAWSPD